MSPDAAKTYAYTKRGQPETVKLGVDGIVFASRLHYDDVGRVKALDYPQPLGQEPFGVVYELDAYGHRIATRDAHSKDTYWQLSDVDQAGRYAQETFGNGTKTTREYDAAKSTLNGITTTRGASCPGVVVAVNVQHDGMGPFSGRVADFVAKPLHGSAPAARILATRATSRV